jgi:hypothetical protein
MGTTDVSLVFFLYLLDFTIHFRATVLNFDPYGNEIEVPHFSEVQWMKRQGEFQRTSLSSYWALVHRKQLHISHGQGGYVV